MPASGRRFSHHQRARGGSSQCRSQVHSRGRGRGSGVIDFKRRTDKRSSSNLSHMPIHFEGSRSERSFRARPHAQQTVLPSTPPDGSDDAFSSPSRLFEQGQAHALGTTPENIQNNESGDFYETVNAEEVVLAVSFVERGSLGCAYFATNTQELRILHDMQYADVDVLEALLAHVQPTVVLLPLKTPEVVVSLFERHANIWDEGSGQCSYAIRMLTSANFSHSNAVKRLANLKLSSMSALRAVVRPGLAGGTTESFESTSELRLHSAIIGVTRLSSFIDLDSLSSVACAGAILGELSRYDGHADDPGHIRCRDLQMFALKDYLLVSNDTMSSLQILRSESHPNNQARGTNFRESRPNSRVTVRWGVNDELDRLKRDYNGMEDLLSQVVSDLSNELPEWARNIVTSCIFWPQLGFLTMVPLCPDSEEPMYDGQGLDCDNWQIMFSAERKAYYKNRRMRELDAHLGDMYGGILGRPSDLKLCFHTDYSKDLEVEILHNLAVDVMVHEDALLAAADICGELDALVAMALAAGKYGWTAPKVTMSNVLSIRAGRHPLQELVLPLYIPNDCYLSGGEDHETPGLGFESRSSGHLPMNTSECASMTVLTGPNHSGKSVYLKHVALITYLAHIGSYVPAEEAIVGLTDKILTRLSTRETVSRNESSFAVDLKQVAFCLKSASPRSLVLVDEFGKGTASDDGAGLMAALVNHFVSLRTKTPRVLAATHFHEIFEGRHVSESPYLTLAHMDIRLDSRVSRPDNQLVYLYRLIPGVSTESFGAICAALSGVDSSVVDRAKTIAHILSSNEDLNAAYTTLDAEDYNRLRDAEDVARRFLNVAPRNLAIGAVGDVGNIRNTLRSVLYEDTGSNCHL
ncbi:DNA mismatch repair protein mutS [Verticillium dahliae VdLs.17]|uniref:DNA mismatch repair protein MSH5 n=2 Tax=Verticillium dahliae TaxID=27337 RepID=G2XFB3_VERDV|nr:DNA mismatch repair protein mutS [Verticillium dahliae VdLs.17]EGY18511.1 DNA mismatch repair protein mutS [Verticillium dahliae VdLs.17]